MYTYIFRSPAVNSLKSMFMMGDNITQSRLFANITLKYLDRIVFMRFLQKEKKNRFTSQQSKSNKQTHIQQIEFVLRH